ncbi:MAG: MBL fold metallo-hydrolase, partial [Candidatus Pacearchaeota archaeon]
MLKVFTIGGYNEVGKNMTAILVNNDAFIFDIGFYLPAVIDLQESERQPTPQMLKNAGAFPDDSCIEKIKSNVRAIFISHAHLDHVGAVQYLASKYPNAQIYGTPFTIEVLKALLQDSKIDLKNKLNSIYPNSSFFVKGRKERYLVDFVNVTHSTLQTAIVALHTPHGIVVYANDFKLDNNPTLGMPPNYSKLKELSKKGVALLIVDSLYSGDERKTHSEKIARVMVEEVLLTVNHQNRAIVITTFSSHIARLKSIVDFSRKLNRKVVFIGRSLLKYVVASQRVNLCPFKNEIELVRYKNQVKSKLKRVQENRDKYVVVCTGHQGEEGSILDRIVKRETPFILKPQDSVIFSSKVIPHPINIANRANIE